MPAAKPTTGGRKSSEQTLHKEFGLHSPFAAKLKETSPDEWMDAEGAAAYLKRFPEAFQKVVAKGEIPKPSATERGSPCPAQVAR